MSPNSIFDNAFSKIKTNKRMKRIFGENLKAYRRDHNGKRKGRRNLIEWVSWLSILLHTNPLNLFYCSLQFISTHAILNCYSLDTHMFIYFLIRNNFQGNQIPHLPAIASPSIHIY